MNLGSGSACFFFTKIGSKSDDLDAKLLYEPVCPSLTHSLFRPKTQQCSFLQKLL